MTTPSSVSVVLLNWNSGSLGASAAVSVAAQTHPVELIVVDNGSDDDSLDLILAGTTPDQIIRNPINTGFAAGMNAGIAASRSDFVLPLNCDAELGHTYVETLLTELADPRVAVAGGLVRTADRCDAGPLEVTSTMRTRRLGTTVRAYCGKVDGACPLQRRAALEQVVSHFGNGPYDESYDTYGEDIDLAWKLRRLGWRIVFNPSARARHVRSFASARRLADKRGRLRVNNLANRHRNITRHSQRPLFWNGVAAAEDLLFSGRQLLRGDHQSLRDITSAWLRAGRHLHEDLGLRERPRRIGAHRSST